MKKNYYINFFELIKTYLCEYLPLIRRRSSSTVKTSRESINIFIAYQEEVKHKTIYDISFNSITASEITAFGEWLLNEKHRKTSTVNLRISRLKTFARYIAENCSADRISQFMKVAEVNKYPDIKGKLPNSLSIEQTKLLFSMPNKANIIEFRDYCLITLMYDSACRDEEIRNLKLEDITLAKDRNFIRVLGKGSKSRLATITNEEAEVLEQYIKLFHVDKKANDYLFYVSTRPGKQRMSNDNTLRIQRKYSDRAKLIDPNFPHSYNHMMRHSRSQHLYDANMPLPTLSDILGHSDINTTRVYASASTDKKREAINKAMCGKKKVLNVEKIKFNLDEDTIKVLYGLK
jgi:site-specific recombinase XerD